MKRVFILGFLSLVVVTVTAQKKDGFRISVGPELAFPTGALSSSQSFGIGATGQIEISLQEKLNFVGYSGILLFKGKGVSGQSGINYSGQTIIPVRAGVKYFLTDGIYGGFQAGLGFLGSFATGTAFSYSPQIGYEFKTNSGKAIDATVKYDAYSKGGTLGSLGFRVAYIF